MMSDFFSQYNNMMGGYNNGWSLLFLFFLLGLSVLLNIILIIYLISKNKKKQS